MHGPLPPELAVFEKDVGVWDADVVVRFPGQPESRSRGVSTNRLAHGGRWLVVDYQADSGFAGHGVYGWDANKRRYVGTWVDNMRDFLAIAEGTWDPERRAMTYVTTVPRGPDGQPFTLREVTETVDADTQIFRSYSPTGDGGELEMMTVTYRRRR